MNLHVNTLIASLIRNGHNEICQWFLGFEAIFKTITDDPLRGLYEHNIYHNNQ